MKWATIQRRGVKGRSRSNGQLVVAAGRCGDGTAAIHLKPGAVHRMPAGVASICCVSGNLWLTIEGDAADHVLRPGQSRRLPSGRTAVVQALSTVEFTLG